jgi:unsaturated chondroitin disaccharide hydrolase
MGDALNEAEGRTALEALLHRVATTLEETGEEFPLVSDPETEEWEATETGNWCAGHWIGLLWLAYAHADADERDRYEAAAREHTDVLRESSDQLDTMFGGMNYLYAGFRAYDVTGDRSQFGLGLTGADAMVGLFHETAQLIPRQESEYEIAGPEYDSDAVPVDDVEGLSTAPEGSSDSIYTAVPVLWRAYRETNDPRFRDIAVSHANRHLRWHVREDGRTWNRTVFDPETGEAERHYNKHAHSDQTCWARGHGWIMAGYAEAYAATGAERYLEVLERTAEYYVRNSPDDLVPYWDFEDPDIPDAPRDTSAAALVAYGLARLEADNERAEELRRLGEEILASLVDSYLVSDPDDPRRGMVLDGCYEKPSGYAIDNELIWTTYYLAYTLDSLLGTS